MDAKGRFTLPGNLRDQLPEPDSKLIITSDPAQACLLIYPKPHWEGVASNLAARSDNDRARKSFAQIFLGNSQAVELDANGRLIVPPYLRKVAQLEKKIFLRGFGHKIELWDIKVHETTELQRTELLRAEQAGDALDGIVY